MPRITPFLWFDAQAEAAVNFYTSIFGNSKIVNISRYDEAGARVSGRPKGSVMTIAFELEGQPFMALNGGPMFQFTEAISFVVNCETQEEVDELWEKLCAGGTPSQCGWLKDKYGVSWQIIPTVLSSLMQDPDAGLSKKVMEALLQMTKIDIQRLQQAYDQD